MDAETPLGSLFAAARAFEGVSAAQSPNDAAMGRIARLLPGTDLMERLIPEKLLYEVLETLLRQKKELSSPLVIFMNRGGHGDGARSAPGLTSLLAAHYKNPRLLHVSFNTPKGGLGALVRSAVAKSAAEHDIEAAVSIHNLPVERLTLSERDVDEMLGAASLVISYAASGTSAVMPRERISALDPLLSHSHAAVLSFPDPEGLPGDLPRLEALVAHEPNFSSLRFWVQVVDGEKVDDLGVATLSRNGGGDAHTRLWQLIENARRRPYRVLVEPSADGVPSGFPLVCPCRSLLTAHNFIPSVRVLKVVPVGSTLAVTAVGIGTEG